MRNVVIATALAGVAIAGLVTVLLGRRCVHVVPDGEAHVVQRFGRFRTVRKPGVRLRLPVFERVSRVTVRPFGLPLTAVASTRDGRVVRLQGAVEVVIVDPRRYVTHHAALRAIGPSLVTSVAASTLAHFDAGGTTDLGATVHRELAGVLQRYGVGVVNVVVRSITPVDQVPVVSIAAA